MKLSEKQIGFCVDANYGSGFGCDAKEVGNILDDILEEMNEQGMVVPVELQELKQYLRHKGNAKIDSGDKSLWDDALVGDSALGGKNE